jgi:hypothetical protein
VGRTYLDTETIRRSTPAIKIERDFQSANGLVDLVIVSELDFIHEVPCGTPSDKVLELVRIFERGFGKGHETGVSDAREEMKRAIGLA